MPASAIIQPARAGRRQQPLRRRGPHEDELVLTHRRGAVGEGVLSIGPRGGGVEDGPTGAVAQLRLVGGHRRLAAPHDVEPGFHPVVHRDRVVAVLLVLLLQLGPGPYRRAVGLPLGAAELVLGLLLDHLLGDVGTWELVPRRRRGLALPLPGRAGSAWPVRRTGPGGSLETGPVAVAASGVRC